MKKNTLHKMISFMCAFFLVLSTAFSNFITFAKEEVTTPMTKGTIIIEAEDMSYESTMRLIDDSKASGTKAMKVYGLYTPQADRTSPSLSDSPDLSLTFTSDTSKTVYFWIRVKMPNGSSDSFFYSVKGENYRVKHLSSELYDSSEYHWIYVTSFETFSENEIVDFKIQYREPNLIFDKFVLTDDITFDPKNINDVPMGEWRDYSSLYPLPEIKPIEGHPRLLFNKNDIERIVKNASHPEMKSVFDATSAYADSSVTGILDTSKTKNYNEGMLGIICAKALYYALGLRDESYAQNAIDSMKNYLETVRFDYSLGDETRDIGFVMMTAAAVYDWCYDKLTDDDKEFFIYKMKALAKNTEVGYPPTKMQSIFGHGGEGEVLAYPLACGIAVYDEDKEFYNLSAGRVFSEFTKARIMWNKSGAHSVGHAYGLTRFDWENFANLLFRGMGMENIMGTDDDITSVAHWFLRSRLPNGSHMKIGDDYAWSAWAPRTWWRTSDTSFAFVSHLTGDPYISRLSLINDYISGEKVFYKAIVPAILLANPESEKEFSDSLPLANKTNYPLSSIQARTNWKMGINSNAAVAYFEAREKQYNDHAHADLGSFQIYYKGYLAIAGGSYNGKGGGWGTSHYWNYYTRTIANNCMTVFDPNEKTWGSYANDGGQKLSPDVYKYEEYINTPDEAKTEGFYIGPNDKTPEFSYIKTNLTGAYGANKVENHQRSMVFMDLDNDEYPASVIIFDNITSSDKTFKKTWLMNTVSEPKISGVTSVVSRTDNGYNGKLVNKTLIPENSAISKVGGDGKDSYVNGKNYPNEDLNDTYDSEQGNWRIEISPKEESKKDLFLNSMYVTDYDKNLPELPMYKEETDSLVGVTVMDRTVYFSKDKNVSDNISLVLRNNGYETVKCLITDIEPGIWKVSSSDGTYKIYEADSEEKTLYFRGKPGSYTLTKQTTGQAMEEEYLPMEKPSYGDFLVYNKKMSQFIPLDDECIIENGKKLVPIESLSKGLGGTFEREGQSFTICINGEECLMTLGITSAVFEDGEYELSVAPKEIDSVIYVCPDDLWNTDFDTKASILTLNNRGNIRIPVSLTQNLINSGESVPAGTKLEFNLGLSDNAKAIISGGGKILILQNGKEIYTKDNKVTYTIENGINTLRAIVYDKGGTVKEKSEEFLVYGIGFEPNESLPGYVSDFDKKSVGWFDSSANYSSKYYADPDTSRNSGNVAYGKWSKDNSASPKYSSGRLFTVTNPLSVSQGRFFEVSADIKTNAPVNKKTFHLLNFTFNKKNPITDISQEGFGVGIMVTDKGKICCYNVNAGTTEINADLNNWHNYKIIFDTNPGGTPKGYYYIDNVLIYVIKSASTNIRAVQSLDISAVSDGVNDTELFIDNMTLKTFDSSSVAYIPESVRIYSSDTEIFKKSEIDLSSPLIIKGSTEEFLTDGKVYAILAIKKNGELIDIYGNEVQSGDGVSNFELTAESLPNDIREGNYTFTLYIWGDNINPHTRKYEILNK